MATPQIEFCKALGRFSSAPAEDIAEFVLRDILNVVLGNTDNHGRNSAVLRRDDNSVRLSPIFDFAPMILDPEGVARRCRWQCEREGGLDWGKVIQEIKSVSGDAADQLQEKIKAFGKKMNHLTDIMEQAGVDRELIEGRAKTIDTHRKNILEL